MVRAKDAAISGGDYEFEDLYLGALLEWTEIDTCGTPHLVDG